MSTMSRRRLMRDLKRLEEDCPEGITAAPCPDNIMVWNAVIFGPPDTPFEEGTFRLTLKFDESYPNRAPEVRFITPLFHPNIYNDGRICLDILQNRWSPTYDVTAILTSIQSLLPDPNPDSSANQEAGRMFKDRRVEYERRVRECVERSWMDGSDSEKEEEKNKEKEKEKANQAQTVVEPVVETVSVDPVVESSIVEPVVGTSASIEEPSNPQTSHNSESEESECKRARSSEE